MRILIIVAVLLMALGAAVFRFWAPGSEHVEDAAVAATRSPSISRLVDAVYLQTEVQRLREALGEATLDQRVAQNRAAVEAWGAEISLEALAQLRDRRQQLAMRYFAAVDAALLAPNWPAGDGELYAARARLMLLEARSGFAYAQAADAPAAAALEFAAAALALAQGEPGRLAQFQALQSDLRDVVESLAQPELRQPERGDQPVPPTALTLPMGQP